MPLRQRIDRLLVEKQLCQSRERARALILAGRVLVDNRPCDKPGTQIPVDAHLLVKGEDLPYVSRGGLKLEAALKVVRIDCTGMVCLDVGASTGGFTDCLLQHGAERVFALDVGYGQLAWPLRQDRRVVVIERTNIRKIDPALIPCLMDLITVDTSFISLKLVVPCVLPFLKPDGTVLALIKPQFEVGKGEVGKGGVVRNPLLHQRVIDGLRRFFTSLALVCGPIVESPIRGTKGNREFMIVLRPA